MLSSHEYTNWEKEGAQRRRWIEDPNEPDCYIPRAEVSLLDLKNTYSMWDPTITRSQGPKSLYDPSEGPEWQQFQKFRWKYREMQFAADARPNSLTIRLMSTPANPHYELPPISEVANALYADSFALNGLEHIFVRRIVNDETKSCLEDFILPRHPVVPVSGSLTLNESESMPYWVVVSEKWLHISFWAHLSVERGVLSASCFGEIMTGDI